MTKKFSSKDPEEIIIITFDYTDQFLDASENITTVQEWEISVAEGVDASPTDLFTGIPTFDAKTVSHMITGGLNGVSYLISCTVNTTKGQRIKMAGILPIISQGN